MISIVIPVFNVPEKHFERCISSIQNQSYKEIEVLVVDDGSAPVYQNYYRNICAQDNRFTYIFQKNQGVSAARNNGIDYSHGEYITFVDADDEMIPGFLQQAVPYMEFGSDLVVGKIVYCPFQETRQKIPETVHLKGKDKEKLKKALLGIEQKDFPYCILGSPCGRLYRSEFTKKIRFDETISHWEDQVFNREYLKYVDDAWLVNEEWYKYYQNDFSAMHQTLQENYLAKSKPFWDRWDHLNRMETDEVLVQALQLISMDYYYAAIHQYILPSQKSIKTKRTEMDKLLAEPIFSQIGAQLSYDRTSGLDKLRLWCVKHQRYWLMMFFVYVKTYFMRTRKNG